MLFLSSLFLYWSPTKTYLREFLFSGDVVSHLPACFDFLNIVLPVPPSASPLYFAKEKELFEFVLARIVYLEKPPDSSDMRSSFRFPKKHSVGVWKPGSVYSLDLARRSLSNRNICFTCDFSSGFLLPF